MNNHVQECPANWNVGDMPDPCPICPILRACEARVRKELEEYYNNPCMFCGPDSWSTYVCDECKEEFESEEENE